MAGVAVVPVNEEDFARGSAAQRDAAIPRIVREHQIRRMRADVGRTLARHAVLVDPVAVDVVEQNRVAIFGRERGSAVDQRAAMRVSAAGRVGAGVGDRAVTTPPSVVADVSRIVRMIGDAADLDPRIGIEMSSALPLIATARHHVPKVGDHAGGDESLAAVVKVHSPRVAGAPREDLEVESLRMQPPHTSVERHARFVGSARLADFAVREDAVGSVEPAVRTPDEGVERFVRVFVAPAVEE